MVKARAPDDHWIKASEQPHFNGGTMLSPRLIHHPEADGRLVLPHPKFFGSDGRALRNGNQYDAVGIDVRGISGGTSVVQYGLTLSDQEHTERPYAENVWVRAGVKAFSQGFSLLPLQFFDRDPHDDAARVLQNHPLVKLFERPNKMMSQLEFFRAHVVDYKHDGEVYWFLLDAVGDPVETDDNGFITKMPEQILPLRGALVEILTDQSGFPEFYRYRRQRSGVVSGTEFVEFPAAAVIPFLDFDPYNMIRGLGDVRALVREIDLYFQAYRYLDAVVKNGGDPGGFIVYEERIGPAEVDRRQAEADDEYALTNAGRIKVLDRGAKFVPSNVKPKDMEYPTLFAWQREAILTGLGVPPPVVGVLDNAIFNNIETARREMWMGPNGIVTVKELTEDVMRNKLIWRMQRVQGIGDVWPDFDTSRVQALSINRDEKINRASEIAARGHGVSFNEMLSIQGVEGEFPDSGDLELVDQKFVPAAEAEATDSTGSPPEKQSAAGTSMRVVEVGGIRLIDDVRSPACKKKGESQKECVARKIPEIVKENPGMDQKQAIAIAFSMCKKPCGSSSAEFEVQTRQGGKGEGKSAVGPLDAGKGDLKLAARVEAWLTAYEKAQITRLRVVAGGRAELTLAELEILLLNEEVWAQRLARTTKVPLRDIWAGTLTFAQGQIGGPIITVTDPRIVNGIASQVLQLSEGLTSTTADRVRSAILRVLGGAEDAPLRELIKSVLPELTEELRKVFGTKDARALAISVTETGRAQNSAAFAQMEEAGVEKHRWVNSGDDKVRESHQISTVVVLGQRFPNGLKHPLDPEGPASQVVNCRCKTQVVEQTEEEAA